MKLPPIRKILREDTKDPETAIKVIIEFFNSFAENIYQAMNRNITHGENIADFIKEITYKTSSAYPAAENVEFLSELKTKARGLNVIQAVDKSTYQAAAGPVYAPWVEDNGTIVVGPITGLEASKTYIIRFQIF